MGDVTYVPEPRDCDVCKFELGKPGVQALFDARTHDGRWANLCQEHFTSHTPGRLGTGFGQRLVVGRPPERDRKAEFKAAVERGDWEAMEDAVGDGDPADFL